MKLKTTPFDPADFLDTKESQIELLADAVESGDSRYIADALGTIARARGMATVARESGLTRQALYRSLSENGDPRLTTLLRVAKSLGLKLSFKARKSPTLQVPRGFGRAVGAALAGSSGHTWRG